LAYANDATARELHPVRFGVMLTSRLANLNEPNNMAFAGRNENFKKVLHASLRNANVNAAALSVAEVVKSNAAINKHRAI
jgi:hypothetical protein